MLIPLNVLQNIMFCKKYRIKENIITPKSFIYNFVSMIVSLVLIVLLIFCTYVAVSNDRVPGYAILITFYNCIFYCFGFAMNFVIGIIQTEFFIQFVLIFQKVHRYLNDEICIDRHVIYNWTLTIMAIGFYIIILTYFYIHLGIFLRGVCLLLLGFFRYSYNLCHPRHNITKN